jgi:hypothetical protein
MNSCELEGLEKNRPDIVLVRRVYPERQNKKRIWKLRRMEKDGVMVDEEGGAKGGKGAKGKGGKKDKNEEKDMEEFMDDIERDKDMRAKMALYRDEEAIKKLSPEELAKRQQAARPKGKRAARERKVIRVEIGKKGADEAGGEKEEAKKDEKVEGGAPKGKKGGAQPQKGAKGSGKRQGGNNNDDDEWEDVDARDDAAEGAEGAEDDDEEEDANEVKLSELMNELRIQDSDEEEGGLQSDLAQQELLDEKLVEDFVKAIGKVKIEK